MAHDKPIITHRQELASSALFTIEGIHLKFANGNQRDYEIVQGGKQGAVMIVPMLDANTILLIREYAAGVDDYVLTFPKGAIDAGENFLETANRELQEEVGYAARSITNLTKFCTSPGYMTAMMQVVLATDLYPQSIPGDEPEPIEVVPWKLTEIDRLLAQPDFYEGRAVAALLLLERKLYGGN